jgi:hypothetical protein
MDWPGGFNAESQLNEDGFLLMRQVLPLEAVQAAQACISTTKPYTVNYTAMEAFINTVMRPTVNTIMQTFDCTTCTRINGWTPFDLQVIKYRVSDFGNAR